MQRRARRVLSEIKNQKSKIKIGLALVALFVTCSFAFAAEPADAPKDLVLGYYYPWYYQGDWSRHGYDGTPVLGKYGTDDPKTVEQHIKWAKRAGLDAFVISWWGPEHLTEKHLREGYLNAPNVGDIKFAFIYECLGRLDEPDGKVDSQIDFANPAVLDRLVEDFTYLRDHFFSHPSYLKIGGRPVVSLYVTRTFRHFEHAHLDELQKRIGVKLFLIGDEPFFGDQKDPATARNGLRDGRPMFDAYTAYNMFEDGFVKEGESALSYQRREAMPIYKTWAEKTVFCPGVIPRYADFRGHKRLTGTPDEYVTMIREMKQLPLKPVGDGVRHIYFITSFNEWWEGTTIEPATEYGEAFLDATRRAFRE
ncbi:MAG: hypothetical protein GC159_01255 [Phycisphaera sp.]|nr:hypothetical protein [Phycisphaera sp.]